MGNEDIIKCISEHDVLAVVDIRHNKIEDRIFAKGSKRWAWCGWNRGPWGVYQYAVERKSKE